MIPLVESLSAVDDNDEPLSIFIVWPTGKSDVGIDPRTIITSTPAIRRASEPITMTYFRMVEAYDSIIGLNKCV